MLQIVKALCEDAGHELAYLDGQTPGAARQGIVDAFNAPGSRTFAFLVSTHAGGVGLNITAANRVVIVDPDWSPAKDLQAMARAFRIGQRRAVRPRRRRATAGTGLELWSMD
jgi:SNF2 family DNA or RNA helicase